LDLLTNQATNSVKVNEWFGYTVQGYSREEGFNPIHPEDRGRVDEVISGSLQSEAASRHDVTYRVVHPQTGVVRHLRSFGKAMFNDEGKPYLIIGIIQDITSQILNHQQLLESEALLQQKVLERTLELEKANNELKRSNQNLEEFAYAASHDMKEPIRKIHFFADRLKERLVHKLDEEDRRYFERMENGANRMNTLIDDLLLYSHVNRGLSVIEMVDLSEVLYFVLDDLELHIEQKGATIEVGPLPTINGRARQLQQLFENLIGNALKYSREGVPPVVQITSTLSKGSKTGIPAAVLDGDRTYHLIEVRDNGIGFAQEDAERIFTVFTRLHGNTEYKGTGVGLSIAQKVVQNHGGYIWAESKSGKGATFKILLPVE
jgi:PAS domain S-box-containing protein